jgi:hypothetical protein
MTALLPERNPVEFSPPLAGQPPAAEVLAEARRLVRFAQEQGLVVRLVGGAAIHLRLLDDAGPLFARTPQDIDLAARKRTGTAVSSFMRVSGYRADEKFNAINGHRRHLYYDDAHGRQVDVFFGDFAMCHTIPFAERLILQSETVPWAELLLMKLQIYALNTKDQRDILRILLNVDVRDDDGQCREDGRGAVNARHIGQLCSLDWGLWRTVTLNLARTREAVRAAELTARDRAVIEARSNALDEALLITPKGRRWKARALVGDRVRWYEDPEEVA